MKFHLSLKKRIVITFSLFCALLGVVYSIALYISLDYIDDFLINSHLKREMAQLSVVYESTAAPLIPTSPNIQVYSGTQSMPAHVFQMVQGISEGIHEKYYNDIEYHIAVKAVSGRIAPLYLIFDVNILEFTETRKIRIWIVLIGGVALVTCLGLWMGVMLSRSVIAPVARLTDQVKQLEPENLPEDLSESFAENEVGALARSFEQAVERIQLFVSREQQFTRDASHELRTPVTVIKGALEVMDKRITVENKSVIRPMNRIRRAVADMENIIETFLWLGREEKLEQYEGPCEVLPIVEKVMQQLRQLFADKPVEIELEAEAEPILDVPPPLFQAVITNLIKNAYQFTDKGKITVSVYRDHLAVSDTGSGITAGALEEITEPYVRGANSAGFGLGLAIVKKLCRRFGWRLSIDSDAEKGTVVYLYFHSSQGLDDPDP